MKRINPKYSDKRVGFIIFAVSIAVVGLYAMLAVLPDLRQEIVLLVLISAVITVFLAMIHYVTDRHGIGMPPWLILGVAALIRIMFVFLPPELSDDIHRYLWDGLQMVSGSNPYAVSPADVMSQTPAEKAILPFVNHPDLITVYPPGAQAVFLWAALLSHRVWVFKCLLAMIDFCTCALIIRLLVRFKLPTGRSILYAWHPLAVLEISGSGHIDAAGIFFLFLSLSFAAGLFYPLSPRGKSESPLTIFFSGLFYAGSCLIKLFPIVFFPIYLKYVPRQYRWPFMAGALSGGLILCLPFMPQLENMAATLFLYARHWEFSGFAFYWLKSLGIAGGTSRWILISLFMTALSAIWIKAWVTVPALVSGKPLSGFFSSLYRINLAFLFLSPTLHPWYALYLVSVLPFAAGLAGFVLSWSVLLAYSVLIPYALTGQWTENTLATLLIWLGPAGAWLVRQAAVRMFTGDSKPHTRPGLP
jgi:hypothetical protein